MTIPRSDGHALLETPGFGRKQSFTVAIDVGPSDSRMRNAVAEDLSSVRAFVHSPEELPDTSESHSLLLDLPVGSQTDVHLSAIVLDTTEGFDSMDWEKRGCNIDKDVENGNGGKPKVLEGRAYRQKNCMVMQKVATLINY